MARCSSHPADALAPVRASLPSVSVPAQHACMLTPRAVRRAGARVRGYHVLRTAVLAGRMRRRPTYVLPAQDSRGMGRCDRPGLHLLVQLPPPSGPGRKTHEGRVKWAEKTVEMWKKDLESARVNSAARDASSTELMAPACRPTRSPTILMPRARSSVERRPTSVRSASISRWLSRPRGRAQRRRKHHLGLGVRSTMARHTPE